METTIALLLAYKYPLFFLLSVFEGPILTVIGGFLSTTHVFDPIVVYVLAVAGDVAGDSLYYAVGRFGGPGVVSFASRILRTDIKTERARELFHEHPKKALVTSKIIHGIGSGGILGAGLVKIPYRVFFTTCFVISVVQSFGLLLIGIFFGHSYVLIEKYLGYFAAVGSAILLIVLAWWFFRKRSGRS